MPGSFASNSLNCKSVRTISALCRPVTLSTRSLISWRVLAALFQLINLSERKRTNHKSMKRSAFKCHIGVMTYKQPLDDEEHHVFAALMNICPLAARIGK